MYKQLKFPGYTSYLPISVLLLLFFGPLNSLLAQQPAAVQEEQLKLSIQLRPRAEVRNGLFTPQLSTQNLAAFISQRNRIGLNYSKGNKITVGLQLQVINVWGKDPQIQQSSNDLSLYEAWAQLFLQRNLQLKVGRQVLSYDDERILGALDWNNAGRKHDAALFKYQKGKFKADIGLAYNQNAERINGTFFNDSLSQPYKSMEFAWMHYILTDEVSFSALVMNLDKQNRIDSLLSHLQTIGTNAFLKNKKISATASFYYQTGRADLKTMTSQKTSAWMGSVYGNYSVSKKIIAGIGSDYLSGKGMDNSSLLVTNFNPLYGTHHKFYGNMDYFYVSSPHKNTGLWDSYINVSCKPTANTTYQLTFHHFEAAGKIIDYKGRKANSVLGNEADLSFQHQLPGGAKISGGYSQIFTATSMKYVKNIPDNQNMKPTQNWIWLSLNIQPEILLFKKIH
ncbi:MAG: alginate export family protein [Pedobacter sp.]|jgi:hypothetical protein